MRLQTPVTDCITGLGCIEDGMLHAFFESYDDSIIASNNKGE